VRLVALLILVAIGIAVLARLLGAARAERTRTERRTKYEGQQDSVILPAHEWRPTHLSTTQGTPQGRVTASC
jgi:hypothetical protein